jgi:prepilin-type N-terminal cleavage/methylation domain-containing protein
MMFHRLKLINKNQLGFTLIELMLAVALSGIITGAITTTIIQVVTGTVRTNNHMIAVRQVQSAGYWISHDTVMIQQEPVIVNNASSQLESITLTWYEWNSDEVHEVVYSLADNNLRRSYSVNGTTETGIIAEFINPDPEKTKCEFTGGKLTFTITATVGAGSQAQSETRVYEVKPRPGS